MSTAKGSVQCNGSRLIATFVVDGRPRYIDADIKPLNQAFACDSATLTYVKPAQLDGACRWNGTAGRDDLQMDFGGGVSIAGRLAAPRSSIRVRGAGAWSTVKPILPPKPSSSADETQGSLRAHPVNSITPHAKVAREQPLMDSSVPIIAYALNPLRHDFGTH